MVKTNKNIKHTRKVILLKFKDGKETLILSKTFKRNKEKLTIKVKCKTKINKRLIDTESKEKYPLHQLQLKERIVPCCCRAKCFKKQNIIKPIKKEKYNRDLKNVSNLFIHFYLMVGSIEHTIVTMLLSLELWDIFLPCDWIY